MRAFVPITASELKDFLHRGEFVAPVALALQAGVSASADDLEEMEFELSWEAAQISRERSDNKRGFALALDLSADQIGAFEGTHLTLLAKITMRQVESVLVSDSEEPELSWFAVQEIPTYLDQWMA